MANKRISELTREVTTPEDDDYLVLDSETKGTGKMAAGVLATEEEVTENRENIGLCEQNIARIDQEKATKAELATKIDEAPEDGKQYARKDGAWAEVESSGGATEEYVDNAVAAENTARTNADSALQTAIDNETKARQNDVLFSDDCGFQIYSYKNGGFYVEEDTTNKKLFVKSLANNWYIRGYFELSYTNSALASAIGTSLVKSTEGVADCIVLTDEQTLSINRTTKLPEIVTRKSLSSNYKVIIAQNGGFISAINPTIALNLVRADVNNLLLKDTNSALRVYDSNSGILSNNGGMYIEEDTTNKKIFFKPKTSNLVVRGAYTLTYTASSLASSLGISLVTSTSGEPNCLVLADEQTLVFDKLKNAFKILDRSSVGYNHLAILANSGGFVVYLAPYFMRREIKDAQSELADAQSELTEVKAKVEDLPSRDISSPSVFYPENYELEISNIVKLSDFTFGFFTDVHASSSNVSRIVATMKAIGVDAILNGGDTVLSNMTEGLDWYNSIVNSCSIPILTTAGNHDCWESTFSWKDATSIYSLLIPTIISQAGGIVQPDNAEANGLCYYYKDFSNIRIIVLNGCRIPSAEYHYWDDTEKEWLESVLADAKTNGKSVICLTHYPFNKSAVGRYSGGWNSWKNHATHSTDGMVLPDEPVSVVKSFIDDGGSFICWLSGHCHWDNTMYPTADDRQFMLNCASSRYNYHNDGSSVNTATDERYDCFTLCGVDLTNKMVKFLRMGWKQDSSMQVRKAFAWDFANHKIIG